MRLFASLAFAATTLVATAALAGDAATRLPWDGFGVGSYVHLRSTTTMSVEGVPPQTSESKQTLVKVTDEAFTIKQETKVGEDWMGSEMPFPRKATGTPTDVQGPKPEELGDENVSVDGKDYACKKVRYTAMGATTTTWTHATEGVLKSETKAAGTESTMTVTKLSTKVKAGDKEVEAGSVSYRQDSDFSRVGDDQVKDAVVADHKLPNIPLHSDFESRSSER